MTGARLGMTRIHEIQTKSETNRAVEALWVSVEIIIPSAKNSDT